MSDINFSFLGKQMINKEPCHGFGQLVIGPLSRRLAFHPTSNQALSVVYKLKWGRFFSEDFRFPLRETFHSVNVSHSFVHLQQTLLNLNKQQCRLVTEKYLYKLL
jgi:hypothetical protein